MSCSPSTTTTTTSPAASSSTIGLASMWGRTIPRDAALLTGTRSPAAWIGYHSPDGRSAGALPGEAAPGSDARAARHRAGRVARQGGAALRRAGAPRAPPALGPAAGARGHARVLGDPARDPAGPGA